MVLTSLQAQTLINWFNHLKTNQKVQMDTFNNVLSSFERNINTGFSTGLKIYLQATKETDKETYKIYISVSNAKDIVDHFLS